MPRAPARGDKAPRRGIQSVGVGFSVLRALVGARGPLPLKEIAARSGMPADKAFRYLVSFVASGLVKQDPASARYDLGPFAMELGLAAHGRINDDHVQRVGRKVRQGRGQEEGGVAHVLGRNVMAEVHDTGVGVE